MQWINLKADGATDALCCSLYASSILPYSYSINIQKADDMSSRRQASRYMEIAL